MKKFGLAAVLFLLLLSKFSPGTAVGSEALTTARRLLWRGDYANATEATTELLETEPAAAASVLAQCKMAQGDFSAAVAALNAGLEKAPEGAGLFALLAQIAFERGDYDEAASKATAALEKNQDQLLARWIRAELHRVHGRHEAAGTEYRWFVRYFNQHDIKDPDDLRIICLGAAQYARWNKLSDQFGQLVNQLLPQCLKLDSSYWPAHYESALLFLEKYNESDAANEINAGLKINPYAAELHVLQGKLALERFEFSAAQDAAARALELNPRLLSAHWLKADSLLLSGDFEATVAELQQATQLNPRDLQTLGRLAAAFGLRDGQEQPVPDSQLGKIVTTVREQNPQPGEFYQQLAESFDRCHRYPTAAQYFDEAFKTMPQMTAAPGALGLTLMRLGDEDRSRAILTKAFESDPFNVRISNTLQVLELLTTYETLETQHFLVRFDPKQDKVLAHCAADWLEQVYPELCERMGFTPKEKTLFEIFGSAKGARGHNWFAIRMVGLPAVHTIGACAGKMVAMQSPTDPGQKFDWARVLKHEFVHVLNLQQTSFRVPRWFTEGLATWCEDHPPPQAWREILAKRLAQNDVFTLRTIDRGFIRPHNSDDWTLAYYQAKLYVEFMRETYGPEALGKMLNAYGEHQSTSEVIQSCFQVDLDTFDKAYRVRIEALSQQTQVAKTRRLPGLNEAKTALAKDPENLDRMAELAQVLFNKKGYAEARIIAKTVLSKEPKHALASLITARLLQQGGDEDAALELLKAVMDEANPDHDTLALLAGLELKRGLFADAARHYELGAKHNPGSAVWLKSLAATYLKSNNEEKLASALAALADIDEDDVAVRRKLAELAIARQDFETAAKYATQGTHLDVMDAEFHRILGQSLLGQSHAAAAKTALETAIELEPKDVAAQIGLVKSLVALDEKPQARERIEDILRQSPENPDALQLQKELSP